MKPQSMEEKISYRLFFMGFVGLVCTAVLCLFVFHKAFREQAWTSLEHQADLVSAGFVSGSAFRVRQRRPAHYPDCSRWQCGV